MASLLHLLDYYRKHASEVAFVQQRGYRRQKFTYGDTLSLAERFAAVLDSRSIAKGDRVILWGDNCAEWIAAFLGCMMRGVVVVPLDRTGAADFAKRVADSTQAKLAIVSRDLLSSAPAPPLILEDLSHELPPRANAHSVDLNESDLLQIIFTSGTTAEPKGVVITHGNVLANLRPFEAEIPKYLKYERLFHPIRFLDLVPLSHVFGEFVGAFVAPLLGGTVVFSQTLNPHEVIRTIKRERVSVLVTVPRLLESLQRTLEPLVDPARLEAAKNEHFVKRWWRFRRIHSMFGWKFWAIVSGGATLDPHVEEFFTRLSLVVLQGYGMTETTSIVSLNHPFRRGKGSIGKVLAGREMKLSPTGEILVRGDSIARNYWQGGELVPVSGDSEDDAGWLRTGDVGQLDAEGFLHFKGRSKNIIVTAEGMKVYPEDLERELRAQPGVRDCVVVAVERGGNAEPCAVMLLETGASAAEITKPANARLAAHQQLRHAFAWPAPDFPRTNTGKIKTNDVLAWARAQVAGTPVAAASGGVSELLASIKGRSSGRGDLGLSSIERVELMCALEEKYQVSLNETQFAEAETLEDVERLVSASAPADPSTRSNFIYPHWAQRWPMTWFRPLVYYVATFPATILLAWPRVIGRENLAGHHGTLLLVSNHLTYIDIGFILFALPVRLRKLAVAMEGERLQAMRKPIENWHLWPKKRQGPATKPSWTLYLAAPILKLAYYLVTGLFNVFPLPKLSGFRESFAFAGDSVDRGYSVLVFPEGLRSQTGEMAPFRSGIGMLASRLNIPVLPMKIEGLWEAKQRGRFFARWKSVTVKIGRPIGDLSGSNEEIAQRLKAAVKQL